MNKEIKKNFQKFLNFLEKFEGFCYGKLYLINGSAGL